jgi:hypothetical protein
MTERKAQIKNLTNSILYYQKEVGILESLFPITEETIRRHEAEIERLGGGAPHTGSQFNAGMRVCGWYW